MTPSALPDPSPEEAQALLRSERFRKLAGELRCLVCQNQTLADSNAELAGDLRAEVLRQMASGKDDAAIKSHLVDRFGEFVLYRPTLNAHNIGLWAGPGVLVALGGLALWRLTRRKALVAASTGQLPGNPGATASGRQGVDSRPDASLDRINALLDAPSSASSPSSPSSPSSSPSPSSSSASPGGDGTSARTRTG
ncbi:MAG: cytochrome c-type biogenesis protein [Burkholderiaceae bacterium]